MDDMQDKTGAESGSEDGIRRGGDLSADAYLDLWEENCMLHCIKGPVVPVPFRDRP